MTGLMTIVLCFILGDTPLHIACKAGRADVVTALTLPLTKPEVKHPYFKCPYKSLPQDNVNNLNHDGRAPLHLAAEHAHSKHHQEAIAALHMYAHCDMDIRVSLEHYKKFYYCYHSWI